MTACRGSSAVIAAAASGTYCLGLAWLVSSRMAVSLAARSVSGDIAVSHHNTDARTSAPDLAAACQAGPSPFSVCSMARTRSRSASSPE